MAKKTTTVQTPEAYKALDLNNNKLKHLCLVKDNAGKLWKFGVAAQVHVIKEAIAWQWDNWQAFDDAKEKAHEELIKTYTELFGNPPPKGEDRITTSVAIWHKWVSLAEDRIKGSPTNPVTPKVGPRKSLENRLYIACRVEGKLPDTTGLKTPQANACLKILRETTTEVDGVLIVKESELKQKIYERAAELHTRQDPWRIFQYYRSTLVNGGFIKHD
jgi:hypothetical protein